MVHFVGAGCGASDLITVRGARLLSEADVIIHAGSLVNPELLNYAKEGCEIHDSASMTLEQVVEVVKAAEAKASIPFASIPRSQHLWRVREQFDALTALGIDYDVCPGVSSMSGAAAALKAEYTLPGVSQTVIVTRMEGRTPVPEKEKLRLLAAHGATMVLFLSAGLSGSLQQELLEGGYGPETPVAIVYKASWPDEKIIRCRLCNLKEIAEKNNVKKTALILVGRFLGDEYARSKLYDPSFTTEFREAEK